MPCTVSISCFDRAPLRNEEEEEEEEEEEIYSHGDELSCLNRTTGIKTSFPSSMLLLPWRPQRPYRLLETAREPRTVTSTFTQLPSSDTRPPRLDFHTSSQL